MTLPKFDHSATIPPAVVRDIAKKERRLRLHAGHAPLSVLRQVKADRQMQAKLAVGKVNAATPFRGCVLVALGAGQRPIRQGQQCFLKASSCLSSAPLDKVLNATSPARYALRMACAVKSNTIACEMGEDHGLQESHRLVTSN